MSLNLGNIDNNFGGLKLNSRVNSSKQNFSSNSIVAIKKKKNDFNLPIIKNLSTSKSDLPEIPQSTGIKLNSTRDRNLDNLPKVNTSVSKGNEKFKLPDIKETISSDALNKNYKGTDASFKDLVKGTAKTVANIGTNLGTGVLKYGEQAMDSMLQFGSSKYNPYYIFNPDKLETHQQIAKELIEEDATAKIKDILGYNKKLSFGKTIEEELEDGSLVKHDNLGGQVVQSIGQMLPSMMMGQGVTGNTKLKEAVSLGGMSIGSFGGGVETAYKNGGSREDATKYGLLNSAIETASEKAFAGIGGVFGKGALDESITNTITSKINSEIGKKLATIGMSAVGEGTEELISDLFQPIAQKLTYAKEEDLLNLYKDQNYLEDFVSGALSSIGLEVMTLPSNNTRVNNFAQKTQTINNQYEKQTINNTTNLSKNNINLRDLQSSNINSPENINQSKNGVNMQNNGGLNNDNNITFKSSYQFSSSNNQKINNLRKTASEYFNNSDETQKMIKTFEKIIEDKNYNVLFDDSIRNSNNNLVNAQIKTLPNGEVEIKLNPNSNRAGEFLIMHEITHSIETNEIRHLINDYAKKNAEFNSALEDLKKTYNTDDVSSEVIADISGQLLGNQEYINSLSMKNPNIFKKIYNKIIELANKITGNSKESLFIKDLKSKWETAYRNTSLEESINNINGSTKYMMTSIKGMKNGINTNDRYNDIKNRYEKALELDGRYDNETIRQNTGWFKDKDGNWEFEISDQYTKFKKKPKIDSKYNLSDIFEASTLYEMYPELKNISIEFKDINGKSGIYNSKANKITINNSMINNLDNLKGTILHEVQHYIQDVEGLPTGTTILFGNKQYVNNKGEIEAADTKNRKDLTVNQRKTIIPESAKEDPIHPNREAILNRKRTTIEKIAEKVYNNFGGNSNEISEETDFKNFEKTNEKNNKAYTDYKNGIKELDNSSFSILKNSNSKEINISDLKENSTMERLHYNRKYDKNNIVSYRGESGNTGSNPAFYGLGLYTTLDSKYAKKYGNVFTVDSRLLPDNPLKFKTQNDFNIWEQELARELGIRKSELYSDDYGVEQYIKKLGYDGLMIGTGKDTDLISYKDVAIKYSQQNDKWQEYLEKNYKATGTRTKLKDIQLPLINDFNKRIEKTMLPIRNDLKEVNSLNKELKSEIKKLKTEVNKINSTIESNSNKEKINLPDKDYYNDQLKIYSEINYDSLSADGKKLYNKFLNKAKTELNIPMDPTKEESYNSKKEIKQMDTKKSRIEVSKKYREQAKQFVKDTELWEDKNNLWKYKVNTMKRNLRDIMDAKQANSIYAEYFEPISENNAKIEKEIEKYNEKIRKLNLNNKESAAVQMFGEYKYNPETMVTWKQIHEYIENNHLDHKKIENAIEVFRDTYDELYQRVNNKLAEQGYSTIEYKKGYFPHFKKVHGTNILTKFAEKLGWKINDQQLPTDIAGLTENFLPGKRWTSFSQHREGKITDYDALQGFDNYIRGAMDIIYHTEDIQKLRAFENEIRYKHSEKGIQEQIDAIDDNSLLYEEEKIKQKEQIFKEANNPLPNLVTELRDYTNNLANKKSALDRSTEQFFGRNIYNTMTNIQNRVSANMVGLNISSALTNFIPITQAWSQVKTKNIVQAIKSSVVDNIYSDNFSEKSVYLTNRTKQADRLSKTKLETITDKAGFLFEKIDEFTSNVIVRGKYLENIDNGMSETQAIKNADEFAKDVMAGRSKGDMPTIFNAKNPIFKTFTAFQLEVKNQYGYMFKDLPNDLRDKGINKLIGAFFKMFIGAWLYNKISDKITGRKSAFSPIDTLSEIISTLSDDKISLYDKLQNSVENVAQDIPFIGGLLGGGRLPISAAIPDVGTTIESITNLSNKDKRDTAIANLKKELAKPLFYVAMPLGGGQAKKTIEGLSMYSSDKDIKGSYTTSGKLRFPVNEDFGSKVQAAIFGQYANENAKEYFDNNRSPLTEKQQKEFKKLNIPISKYWSYRDDLKEINKIKSDKDKSGKAIKGSAGGKRAYQIMNNDNYSKEEKQYLLDSITSSDNKVKINDLNIIGNDEDVYKYYFSLNDKSKTEMINAIKKYNFTGKQLLDFNNVNINDNDRKSIDMNENKAKKENVINYLIKSNLTDEQKNYLYSKNYSDASVIIKSKIPINSYLNLQLKISDYNSFGNKKKFVMQEIANLSGLNSTQKILLTYLSGYSIGNNDYKGWSSNSARKAAFDYIDNLNISLNDKRKICEQAGFKVYKNGKIGW